MLNLDEGIGNLNLDIELASLTQQHDYNALIYEEE
jgi:hypothetical protein